MGRSRGFDGPTRQEARPARKILAVDFEVFGHHPAYVQNIADVWVGANIEGSIDFLLSQKFSKVHPDTVNHLAQLDSSKIRMRFTSDSEEAMLSKPGRRYWNGWKIFCKHALESGAHHGLLLYLDPLQVALWLGQKSPISLSAIYFRPTFHYPSYHGYRWSMKDSLVSLRKKFLLQRILNKPELRELLSLDATAVPYIRDHFRTNTRISHFPDTFAREHRSAEEIALLRQELGIEPGRLVFCMIGILDERKGPFQLLDSIQYLPDQVRSNICILLVGRPTDSLREKLVQAVETLKSNSTAQVILRGKYVSPSQVQSYYTLSDVMLTTYQFHKGSSSALIRAAYEKKPVLSSNYGWLGHMVRTHRMGVEIDSSNPRDIAKGIERFATSDPNSLFDSELGAQLAKDNSQDQMALDLAAMLNHGADTSAADVENVSNAGAR